jgi:hypothetical protein
MSKEHTQERGEECRFDRARAMGAFRFEARSPLPESFPSSSLVNGGRPGGGVAERSPFNETPNPTFTPILSAGKRR